MESKEQSKEQSIFTLAIETSCDETAICLLESRGESKAREYSIHASLIHSQTDIHAQYGGVYPMMAKRAHAHNIIPLVLEALKMHPQYDTHKHLEIISQNIEQDTRAKITDILNREPELLEHLLESALLDKESIPRIDRIAVTSGPGLEPTLWVGINCAKALALLWNTSLISVNHMEGHIVSCLTDDTQKVWHTLAPIDYPALALLISGGHTEFVRIDGVGVYTKIGQTRDDAVGEAFDKVARLLDLPYPGGPKLSALAATYGESTPDQQTNKDWSLPRPMIADPTLDMSFSGLKTAVLYTLRDDPDMDKARIAYEFEQAVSDVLLAKTGRALKQNQYKALLIGGGVSANRVIRDSMTKDRKSVV